MHPSCALIVWLAAILGVQFLSYGGLFLLALGVFLLEPAAGRRWFSYALRARWLLLSLWLILAYNTPGEAVQDFTWAPTYEGVAEATLHAVRLLAMLLCLAWIFVYLRRDGMVSGLWGLMRPLQRLGVDVERLVVRLSLVLENLQTTPRRGEWKQMLAVEPGSFDGRAVLHLSLDAWRRRDSFWVLLSGIALIGVWLR